jgi:hypothetical protein
MRIPPGLDELTAMLDDSTRPEPIRLDTFRDAPEPELVD